MSRSQTDLPERLLNGGATDFERRILAAGARKGPSPEMLAHMAQKIGVSATAASVAVAAKELATGAAAAKATAGAGAGTTALLPWLSLGALAIAVTGAVVGTQVWKSSSAAIPQAPAGVTAPRAAAPSVNPPSPSTAVMAAPQGDDSLSNRKSTPSVSDLRDQIAVIDLARSAVNAGDGRRALDIVRRYQDRFPMGQFNPEAAALKIEALVRLDRVAEARVLAERFLAQNSGTMLAERVKALAGLARP